MIDQMGKLPSDFLPKSIGRLIDGWDASAISNETNDAYKNGNDSSVKPKLLKNTKTMKWTVAFSAIKNEIPTPIFFFYWRFSK